MTPVEEGRDGQDHDGPQQGGDDQGHDDAQVVQQVVHASLDAANILIFTNRNYASFITVVVSNLQLMDNFKAKYL